MSVSRRGDRVKIAGWYIPCEQTRRAIVLVHGMNANLTREFDPDLDDGIPGRFPELAVGLHRRGFAVLMIDLHGRLVVSGHDDRSLRLWVNDDGREVGRITLVVAPAGPPSFTPDSRFVGVGGDRGFGFLWRLPDLGELLTSRRAGAARPFRPSQTNTN
jgi:hypothetical protein